MTSYLYLFYEDYVADAGIDPISIIKDKKEEIHERAIKKLNLKADSSAEVEKAFEELYGITENDEMIFNANQQASLRQDSFYMEQFEQGIAKIKELKNDGSNLLEAIYGINQAISSLDGILDRGAANGLADSAYQELQQFRQKLFSAASSLEFSQSTGLDASDAQAIKNVVAGVHSHSSGYMLELAFTRVMLLGHKGALNQLVNVGGRSLGTSAFMHYKNDPKMLENLVEINEALDSNAGVQSKADAVLKIDNDKVSLGYSWVGFQIKNYSNLTSISTGSYSLGQLDIEEIYGKDMLINIAGTLAGKRYKAKIPPSLHTVDESQFKTQGTVDKIWSSVMNSTKTLGIADAVAGYFANNFTNKVNYYVIRDKSSGVIKVIGVSKILNKIARAIGEGADNFMGIKDGLINTVSKSSSRSQYWSHNVSAFSYEKTPEERSREAYSAVWDEILKTKIHISLNFSSFFT